MPQIPDVLGLDESPMLSDADTIGPVARRDPEPVTRGDRVMDMIRRLAPAVVAMVAAKKAGPLGVARVLQTSANFEHQQQADLQRLTEQHAERDYQRQMEERTYQDRAEQLKQGRKDKAAEFRTNAITELAKLDDPIAFTHAVDQLASIYQEQFGGNPQEFKQGFVFSNAKKMRADQALAMKAVKQAETQFPSERDTWDMNPRVTLSDGRTMKYREARQLAGLTLTKDTGEELAPAKPPQRLTGTVSERAADLLERIAGAKQAGDTVSAARFQSQYDNLLKAQRDIRQADDPTGLSASERTDRRTTARGRVMAAVRKGQAPPPDVVRQLQALGLDPTLEIDNARLAVEEEVMRMAERLRSLETSRDEFGQITSDPTRRDEFLTRARRIVAGQEGSPFRQQPGVTTPSPAAGLSTSPVVPNGARLRQEARRQLEAARRTQGDARAVSELEIDALLSKPGNVDALRSIIAAAGGR